MLRAIDANVPIYAYVDLRDPRKTRIAGQLMTELAASGECVVSTQVLKEFSNVATKRARPALPQDYIKGYLFDLMCMRQVEVDQPLILAGLGRHFKNQISFYDALIVEAALKGGADILYSEDLSHGQRFDSLLIVNPFL